MVYKKNFPFNQVAFTSTLVEAILTVQKKDNNWKYFELISESPISFILKDSDDNSDFYFSVSAFVRENNIYFLVKSSPYGPHKLGIKEQHLDHKKTFESFQSWLSLMKEYENVIDYSSPYFNQHVEEWVLYFDLIDENAEVGLSIDQILGINTTLNQWHDIIERELGSDGEELKLEVKQLQKSLPNTSKRKFVRNFGVLLTKILQGNPGLLGKLLRFVGKEALKELIQQGTGSLLNLG